ncbi:MAG: type II toxin-antitoxin system YafQ family toxin [Treponema sp.]|jgi:mRNA interferase YafQ|nr:type II toxin-antitoxin system YafQ family toxin [Treponema sp.]
MLDFYFQNQFKKDLKLAEKRCYNMDEVYEIIARIIFQQPLPERCRPHSLSGDKEGFIDCHALNDLVLLYILDEEKVTFSRAGTHSDLL